METEDDRPRATRRVWVPLASHLFVVLDCDHPRGATGARFHLSKLDEVRIGRGDSLSAIRSGRSLQITLPGRALSSTHLRLSSTEGGWFLEDAGSTNGSFVNGVRLERSSLRDGDWIEVGRTVLRFRADLPTPPESVLDAADGGQSHALGLSTLLPLEADALAVTARMAVTDVPVLLGGESGTGKEVLARAIHRASLRKGAFVAVNCAALPRELIESQLFGHVRGAFSGALRAEDGLVRAAEGGTLFLDEIGDLPLAAQGALLRVLQEKEVTPVGATKPARVDVRIVAATHRPIEAMAERGEFRGDLLARLSGFLHTLPPLRDRLEDLGTLIHDLLADTPDSVTMESEVAWALVRHRWPFNIRELRHCLMRSATLAGPERIGLRHLPADVAAAPERRSRVDNEGGSREHLRRALADCLSEHRGNVSAVARSMGRAPMQIYRWMQSFGIDPSRYRRP